MLTCFSHFEYPNGLNIQKICYRETKYLGNLKKALNSYFGITKLDFTVSVLRNFQFCRKVLLILAAMAFILKFNRSFVIFKQLLFFDLRNATTYGF
jgi:hypothetical protein